MDDYLRLLWARVGTAALPEMRARIKRQSVDQIVDRVLELRLVLAPVIRGKKGEHSKVLESCAAAALPACASTAISTI